MYVETNVYNEPLYLQYISSMYHSILMFTGNDLGPRGPYQLLFVTVVLGVGTVINAQLFGELAIIVSAMNLKSTRFQDKMDTAMAAMKNIKLPEKNQIQI